MEQKIKNKNKLNTYDFDEDLLKSVNNNYANKGRVIKSETHEQEFREKIIDWTTFYRRNIHRFVEHYLGIKLHIYQKIMIYLMNLCPLIVFICSRAVAKTFITALFGCSICILYPNSKVLVTAMTKKQAGILIKDKIKNELMSMSPNLRREIADIRASQDCIEVVFHNGSVFQAAVAGEQSRGLRSTFLIVDEFRLVKKKVFTEILQPTEILRPTPYTMKPEYEHLKDEPREAFLSSAHYKSGWMWDLIKEATTEMYKGRAILFATDMATTLKWGIKSKAQILRARKLSDETTFDMEYNNFMVGGSENQFYNYDLINPCMSLKKAFYPKTQEEYLVKKRNRFGSLPKQPGEIRLVAMDIAISKSTNKTKNDLSVIACIRALPVQNYYERQMVYMESFEGKPIEDQAIRLRQIFEDFEGDYIVFDSRTYGTDLVDNMARVLYDEERDVEYSPIKVFNNETLKERCKNPNANPCMWAFIGGADSNHQMHMAMKTSLENRRFKMLCSNLNCADYLNKIKEYKQSSPADKIRYELPYIQSSLTLNEMINLNRTFVGRGNSQIHLEEPSTGTKDKYVTIAMANLFVRDVLEVKLSGKTKQIDKKRMLRFRQPKVFG